MTDFCRGSKCGVRAGAGRWRLRGTSIAYHNSWPYFARRFRFDVVAFIGKPGVAPSPAHLAQPSPMGARLKSSDPARATSRRTSRFVAGRLGVPVVRLAISVGSIEGTADYLALFDYNVATLAKALGARGP